MTEQRKFHGFTAEGIMEREVVTGHPEDSGRTLALQMTRNDFGSLPIVDDTGALVGLVSEYDLINVLREGKTLEDVRAAEIMSPGVKTVGIETPIDEVIRLVGEEDLIRVPVMKGSKLVGMLARRDIIYAYVRATASYLP